MTEVSAATLPEPSAVDASSAPEPEVVGQTVLVLDFGGQYSQLIARRIRDCRAYAELLLHDVSLEEIQGGKRPSLVPSGGPASVSEAGPPPLRRELLVLGLPVLGICY